MRNDLQKVARYIYFLVTFLLFTFIATAQTTVTGRITDSKDGSGLAGVTVNAKGTKVGTQTNPDGTFSIIVPRNVTALVFSSVGFSTQQIAIDGRNTINLSLVETSSRLNEVVVVTYGTRKRADLTGA